MSRTTGFDFTVAITPQFTNIDQELRYIKSALLYADKVTLISPLAYMASQLSTKRIMVDDRTLIRIMKTLLPMLEQTAPQTAVECRTVLSQLSGVLYSKKYKGLPMRNKLDIRRELSKIATEIDEALFRMIGEKQSAELDRLLDSKKLVLQPFEHNIMDVDGGVEEFFKLLQKSVKNSYPLFDELSNNLMVAAVNSKIIELSDFDRRKITHAGLSDNLIQRLPSFEMATVDEILDIRKELDSSLIRYRAKVLEYSDTIQSMPWDSDFENECTNLYHREVAPAVQEISELTAENSFVKNLGYSVFSSGEFLKSVGGLVTSVAAGGVISAYSQAVSTDTAVVVSGASWAAAKVAESYHSYRVKKREIQKKDLYFYYKAGEILKR